MLNILFVSFVLLLTLPSCATKSIQKQYFDEGFNAADAECIEIQKDIGKYVRALQIELNEKNKRLDKFNQLDRNQQLRNKKPANPCHENPNGPTCKDSPTGKEDWQK